MKEIGGNKSVHPYKNDPEKQLSVEKYYYYCYYYSNQMLNQFAKVLFFCWYCDYLSEELHVFDNETSPCQYHSMLLLPQILYHIPVWSLTGQLQNVNINRKNTLEKLKGYLKAKPVRGVNNFWHNRQWKSNFLKRMMSISPFDPKQLSLIDLYDLSQ